jgi:hypothetical protein
VPLPHDIPKIEKSEVGTRRSFCVRVEQVVSAHVILVHGFFNKAHSKGTGVKAAVLGGTRGNGGNMMDAEEFSMHKEEKLAGSRISRSWQ